MLYLSALSWWIHRSRSISFIGRRCGASRSGDEITIERWYWIRWIEHTRYGSRGDSSMFPSRANPIRLLCSSLLVQTELKRLYTSLHVLKMKTARKDNPHLSKKPGQRKKNRRFSMQTFQRHAGSHSNTGSAVTGPISHALPSTTEKHEHDLTKTPEDSTGSHRQRLGSNREEHLFC